MVRAYSEMAGEDLPLDFNTLTRPDLSLHQGKLAWAITKAPWKIISLLRLHRRYQPYPRQQMANTLAKVIW